MNLSGGETGICADVGARCGLDFPDFQPETLANIKALLPNYATPHNPLDTTATLSYDPDGYCKLLRTVMADKNVGMALCGFTILPQNDDPCIRCMAEAMGKALSGEGAKPIAIVSFAECSREKIIVDALKGSGIPVMSSTLYSLRVMKCLADYVEYLNDVPLLDDAVPAPGAARGKKTALSEKAASELLAQAGAPMSPSRVAAAKAELPECVKLTGFPVVAKISSPDILHKSDIGGVRVNIRNMDELNAAYDEIMDNASAKRPGARLEGLLVQKMAPAGTEIIIGVNVDPQFGPMVMVGLGGVFVEVFRDVALYPAPLGRKEAEKMLRSLKSYKLLAGYRGGAPLDVEALAETIVKVSQFAAERKDSLAELDINPVFVYERGLCAVDALIVQYE
jgi:acetyltransferase